MTKPVTDQIVLVAFDVQAASHDQAVTLIRDTLVTRGVLDVATRYVQGAPGIESWFFPARGDKWADRNDRDAIEYRWTPLEAESGDRLMWSEEDTARDRRRPQQRTRDRLRLLVRRIRRAA